ncbi:rhodanese-like domain-containing protein [Halomonas halocynthiae]|uniref:rhodanese-like domain-containing protein n=1 Tax=Halomonas halocynthiae TaxID=176290 RepID=UPI0003F5DAF6|nr:rhodanese-like domain-containing protein [Halomonas halocynthiae]
MIDQIIEFVMNNPLLVGAFVVVLLAWLVYEMRSAQSNGVSTSEATQLINREDAIVVDTREAKDFKTGHIAGARNIPQSRLEDRMSELDKFKSEPIIIVCKTGQTAGAAQAKLSKAGFERVFKLQGGIMQWQSDSLPLVRK